MGFNSLPSLFFWVASMVWQVLSVEMWGEERKGDIGQARSQARGVERPMQTDTAKNSQCDGWCCSGSRQLKCHPTAHHWNWSQRPTRKTERDTCRFHRVVRHLQSLSFFSLNFIYTGCRIETQVSQSKQNSCLINWSLLRSYFNLFWTILIKNHL